MVEPTHHSPLSAVRFRLLPVAVFAAVGIFATTQSHAVEIDERCGILGTSTSTQALICAEAQIASIAQDLEHIDLFNPFASFALNQLHNESIGIENELFFLLFQHDPSAEDVARINILQAKNRRNFANIEYLRRFAKFFSQRSFPQPSVWGGFGGIAVPIE